MVIHAVLPIKRLDQAKSRLRATLNADERRALVIEMFEAVLTTLLACRGTLLAEVWVISADPTLLARAEGHTARSLRDEAETLNGALGQAQTAVCAAGATALLIIPGDVPLITIADVAALVQILTAGADVVLAPDRQNAGTNALGLRLPTILPLHFGSHSAQLHTAAALEHGLHLQRYHSPTISLDIDDSESLAQYRCYTP